MPIAETKSGVFVEEARYIINEREKIYTTKKQKIQVGNLKITYLKPFSLYEITYELS